MMAARPLPEKYPILLIVEAFLTLLLYEDTTHAEDTSVNPVQCACKLDVTDTSLRP